MTPLRITSLRDRLPPPFHGQSAFAEVIGRGRASLSKYENGAPIPSGVANLVDALERLDRLVDAGALPEPDLVSFLEAAAKRTRDERA